MDAFQVLTIGFFITGAMLVVALQGVFFLDNNATIDNMRKLREAIAPMLKERGELAFTPEEAEQLSRLRFPLRGYTQWSQQGSDLDQLLRAIRIARGLEGGKLRQS